MKSYLKYYLVGGAVRDHLLGIEAKDKDYVVVGATPQQMIEAGFIQVGKEFPVFLHPETKEEYALARKETKDGKGYKGFKFDFSPNIKLEEDLIRRDLTINAIAMDDQGNITDPYCGQNDLKNQTLKHVSKHFTEDPLRVLRLARFQAQFPQFSIAADTEKLISSMIKELKELSADRVFIELKKSLLTQTPQLFFETLDHLGALGSVFPEISALKNIEQSKDFHPEGDAFTHTMLVLKEASILSTDFSIRFAALTHDLGKAKTPKNLLPSHTDHEKRSMTIIENLCQRLPIPNKTKQLALIVAQNHFNAHQAFELKPEKLLTLLKQTQALKSDQSIFENFLICCKADDRGKLSKEYPQEDFLRNCALQLRELDTQDIIKNYQGSEIGKQIEQRQLQLLQEIQRGTK